MSQRALVIINIGLAAPMFFFMAYEPIFAVIFAFLLGCNVTRLDELRKRTSSKPNGGGI